MKTKRNMTMLITVVLSMVFAVALVTNVSAGEAAAPAAAVEAAAPVAAADVAATITGKVTEAGTLATDSGKEYKLSGDVAGELIKNVGKNVEIKGTVMDKPGEMTIQVQSFKLIGEPSMEKPAK
jgi:hypothetical protein